MSMEDTAADMAQHDNVMDTTPKKQSVSVEELNIMCALSCLEGHFTGSPPMGHRTMEQCRVVIDRALTQTRQRKEVRNSFSRNVEIWVWFTQIFASAIPNLSLRTVGILTDPDRGHDPALCATTMLETFDVLHDDLTILHKLMGIARNILASDNPQVGQDICAGVHFSQMVFQTVILCVNINSKVYDPEHLDMTSRGRLAEIITIAKKLLLVSLQQIHNWTAKHDRNKMAFWLEALFEDDGADSWMDNPGGVRIDVAKSQLEQWLNRNWRLCPEAAQLLTEYYNSKTVKPRAQLPQIAPLSLNWLPENPEKPTPWPDESLEPETTDLPAWDDVAHLANCDALYRRSSHEIDDWLEKIRDGTTGTTRPPMMSVEDAFMKAQQAKADRMAQAQNSDEPLDSALGSLHAASAAPTADETTASADDECNIAAADGLERLDDQSYAGDYVDDLEDEEFRDEPYDGLITGVLTEVPNILGPPDTEVLFMIIKSCIYDVPGFGITRYGEDLQKTRCAMMMATDTGQCLVRELLVFLAVWDRYQETLLFNLMAHIVEALHNNGLIPFTWDTLSLAKNAISPAQAVLLRVLSQVFHTGAANTTEVTPERRAHDLDACFHLYNVFRSRVVPDCIGLLKIQYLVRKARAGATEGSCPGLTEFPLGGWEIDRVGDGLLQFLRCLTVMASVPELRAKLIEWEAIYDLLGLLVALDSGAPKKSLVDSESLQNESSHGSKARKTPTSDPLVERPYSTESQETPMPPPVPSSTDGHLYPWPDAKVHILAIIAALLQPESPSKPGNPEVQRQIMQHNGMEALLNCCVYDDYNRFARERVQLCLKWLMDGSAEANEYIRNLRAAEPPPDLRAGEQAELRIDGC